MLYKLSTEAINLSLPYCELFMVVDTGVNVCAVLGIIDCEIVLADVSSSVDMESGVKESSPGMERLYEVTLIDLNLIIL